MLGLYRARTARRETGLLDGRQATTHWAFGPDFRQAFPNVELRLDEVLVTAGEREEFAMSGGAASWQDLVLYLIGRFCQPCGLAGHREVRAARAARRGPGTLPAIPATDRAR